MYATEQKERIADRCYEMAQEVAFANKILGTNLTQADYDRLCEEFDVIPDSVAATLFKQEVE